MPIAWLNFFVVVFVQFVFLIAHAYFTKQLSGIWRLLLQGVCIGVVIGAGFDLIVGKFIGLHSYELGFSFLFLVFNWVFSYGIFSAHAILMRDVRPMYFHLWLVLLISIYESTNSFFRVWTWEFVQPTFESTAMIFLVYWAGASAVAAMARIYRR
jgi:hypothetical protein